MRVAAFAILFAMLAAVGPAHACSCRPMSRDAVIAATSHVFEGKVLRVRRDGAMIFADVETSRILKGSLPRVVEIGTRASSAACGYPLRVGEQLTFGAALDQQQFTTNMCTMVPLNPRR